MRDIVHVDLIWAGMATVLVPVAVALWLTHRNGARA